MTRLWTSLFKRQKRLVLFSMALIVSSKDGYTVRISAVYDAEARPWIVDTGWRPTDYTYTFSADGTYYWHIRACKPCTPFNPGNWAIRSFTIHT